MKKGSKTLIAERAYIAGFFDGDGHVAKDRHLALTNTNENLLKNISISLDKLGIKHKIKPSKTEPSHKQVYRLLIFGYYNLKKFQKSIPLRDKAKKERLKFLLSNYQFHILSEQEKRKIVRLREKGLSIRKIAKILIYPAHTTVWLYLKKFYQKLTIETVDREVNNS